MANIDWTADGIKQTIQGAIPLVGSFVTGVTTNASDGTIELEGALGSITARPEVVDGGISLQVENVTGLGFTLPREAVQPALDAFTSQLTQDYPMNIHADSVAGHRFRCGEPVLDDQPVDPEADRRSLLRRPVRVSPVRRAPLGFRTAPAGSRLRPASRQRLRRCGFRRLP